MPGGETGSLNIRSAPAKKTTRRRFAAGPIAGEWPVSTSDGRRIFGGTRQSIAA
jgi:hypothetical protein